MGKRQTDITIVLTHIDAAYSRLQASLSTLANNTKNLKHKANVGAAQQDLDHWRIVHWAEINRVPERKKKGRQVY